jgi:hypothetical protein
MCNETIEGDGPDKLSMKLKVHLIHIHEMMVIDEVTRFSSEPSGGGSPDARKKIDNVTRFSSRPAGEDTQEVDHVTRFSSRPAGEDSAEIDEVNRFSSRPAGEDSAEIDEVNRFSSKPSVGDTPESMKLIEVVTRFHYVASSTGQRPCKDPKMEGKAMVSCPMCDSIVYSEDDEGLSEELKNHIDCVHGL